MKRFRQINAALWSAQPIWVKRLIFALVVPAWLVAGYGVLTGGLGERLMGVAAAAICVGAIISTGFAFVALWRNEI